MALRSPRVKKTKTDVEQQFAQLAETMDHSQSLESSKSGMIEQIREAEVRAAVSEITVEVVSKKVAELNVEISRTLSGLSEKMTQEVQMLCSLKEAVAIESKELQRLHGIDVAATAMDQMLADYREKKTANKVELAQLHQELFKLKEDRVHAEEEYNENLKKNRVREQEDYDYRKHLEHKKYQDQFDEECRLRERQNRDAQEQLEKGWKEKETFFKLQEEEFISLKKETEQFPSRLEKECSKVAKEASKEAEAKYSQEIERLKRDLIVEKQIADLKIEQLQELLAASQEQVGALQTQLDESKRQVQDIAVRAIEGASGARALNHVNQIAIEQAKNRPQP